MSQSQSQSQSQGRGRRGAALILVVIALVALLVIATPFAVSMRLQERTSKGFAAEARAEMAARAARELAVQTLAAGHEDAERLRAAAAAQLASSGEDVDDAAELAVVLQDLGGATAFRVGDPKGTILAAEVRDEQGKLNLNSASELAIGNLLGSTELLVDVGPATQELVVADGSVFFSDEDPKTYDGIVKVDNELIVYRHIVRSPQGGDRIVGIERGAFLSTPDPTDYLHRQGAIIYDGRAEKVSWHPFWVSLGEYRPFRTVSALREIAEWELVEKRAAELLTRGITIDLLRRYGVGGDQIASVGLDSAAERRSAPAPEAPKPEGKESAEEKEKREKEEAGRKAAEEAEAEAREAAAKEVGLDGDDEMLKRPGIRGDVRRLGRLLRSNDPKAEERLKVESARLKERIEQLRAHERRYLPQAFEAVARLREARDMEAIGAQELERLRDYLTVYSSRHGDWIGNALILNRIDPDPDDRVTAIDARDVALEAVRGAAFRIDGPGGTVEYRRVGGVNRQNGTLNVFPPLTGAYDGETARAWVAPPHPVNVNTAPVRVLEALLAGLDIRGDQRAGVTPAEARAVAARLVAASPLAGPSDLAGALAAALGAGEIEAEDAVAIFLNATDPTYPQLQRRTAPFAYRSGNVATIVATGIVNDKAGNELARRSFREVVSVAPAREATLHLDSQQDLVGRLTPWWWQQRQQVPILLPARRSFLVSSFPVSLETIQPQISTLLAFPSRSHEPDEGHFELATGEVPDLPRNSQSGYVEHFRSELEGTDLGRGPHTISPSVLPTTDDLGIWPGTAGPNKNLGPAFFQAWFKPASEGGRRYFIDMGDGDLTERIVCFYDPQTEELVLRVADAALPTPDEPWLTPAEVRAPVGRLRRDVWYHVAATWRGSKANDIALFLDGLPVGRQTDVAYLGGAVDAQATSIPLESGGGQLFPGAPPPGTGFRFQSFAVQVGEEVIECVGRNGDSLQVLDLRDPAQMQQLAQQGRPIPPPTGRGARGSRARPHDARTPVQVWGYTNFLLVDPTGTIGPSKVHRGGATLVQPVPARTPTILLNAGTPGSTVAPGATSIPTFGSPAAAGFPQQGFILIEHELVFYRGLGGTSFENCIRWVLGPLPPGSPIALDERVPPSVQPPPLGPGPQPLHYYGFEHIQLASVQVNDDTDYPDRWWIQLDGEWFWYWKPSSEPLLAGRPDAALFRNFLMTCPPAAQIIPGNGNTAQGSYPPQAPTGSYGTADGGVNDNGAKWQELTDLYLQANAPQWARHYHLHLAMDWARGLRGTRASIADHGAGLPVIPVHVYSRPYSGGGDEVTLFDGQALAPYKWVMRFRHTDEYTVRGVNARVLLGAFTDFIPPRGAAPAAPVGPYDPLQGARVVKRPSGRLPLDLPPDVVVGARRTPGSLGTTEPTGVVDGRLDEVKLAEDEGSAGLPYAREGQIVLGRQPLPETWPWTTGATYFHQASRGARAFAGPLGASTAGVLIAQPYRRFGQGVNQGGVLLWLDGEVLACGFFQGDSLGQMKRGALGTAAVGHSSEAPLYPLPFPPIVRLAGGLGGPRGEVVPATGVQPGGDHIPERGYLALDAGNGQGIIEILPYEDRQQNNFVRPVDDRRRGAFRGSFGTARDQPLVTGDLAVCLPFRHFERYEPQLDSPQACHFQATFGPVGGAFFRQVEWDEEMPPDGDHEVLVYARVDGTPPWDTAPRGQVGVPGGLFKFDDPRPARVPNALDFAGRTIELRVHMPVKVGSYSRGTWKSSPKLKALRVTYLEPVRVLERTELP